MKLEIESVATDGKRVRIMFLNLDKDIAFYIPIAEYKEWMKIMDYKASMDRLREFADAYLEGVINHDSTANMLLEQVHKMLQSLYGNQTDILFTVDKEQYVIIQGKKQYRIYKDGRALTHAEIINIYTAVMLAYVIPKTSLN